MSVLCVVLVVTFKASKTSTILSLEKGKSSLQDEEDRTLAVDI